ncbi:hypothetical protein NEOLEDRAFT_534307 [Neolentinus lepideus HHB14362 ss-1]|uniref:Uncharacterized protein n=1 Tax=Neolentinus lepideus HHB14362 ss-1 TaxID=1314782 RepID=A0A165RA47_9AGAM|nr:hypothetical protein NEOLEDRAFT_534307 [Neolentinus lepideus HHB14362 ss-1]
MYIYMVRKLGGTRTSFPYSTLIGHARTTYEAWHISLYDCREILRYWVVIFALTTLVSGISLTLHQCWLMWIAVSESLHKRMSIQSYNRYMYK